MKDNPLFAGTYSTAPTVQKPFTIEDIKRVVKEIGPSPPTFRVQYSSIMGDDEIMKVDMRKFDKLKTISPVFNFVDNWDIWYIIGKNLIEKFQNEGIFVHGIKNNG